MPAAGESVSRSHESLEKTAMLALEFGRMLMEAGGSALHVEKVAAQVAFGLGADRLDLRVGYSSISIAVGSGPCVITLVRKVGPLGVNQRLYHALRIAAARIERREFTVEEAHGEPDRILQHCRHHPDWFVAVAVGIACAAFGRLLGVDWAAVGPICVAGAVGQMVRRRLALRKVNVFISAAIVAFVGPVLCGLLARWAGSLTVARSMVVPVLLLVPGVPLFNAQLDILDGRPTLGSARAVWVAMMLVSMAVGVWLALGLLGEGR
jgi:uncharacterized membrane protein YjjP (DUF1212 family)